MVGPTKSLLKHCLNIKNHAVHSIHKLGWGPCSRWTPGNWPACPCVKTALISVEKKQIEGGGGLHSNLYVFQVLQQIHIKYFSETGGH